MKALMLHEYGSADHLKYEEAPDPVAGAAEVLVRVAAASINPVDWKVRSGALQKYMPLQLPAILGRDVSGTVREVGEGVTGFAPGDRVMALAMGTYAELVVVKAAELVLVPEGLEMTLAGALPLVVLTGEQVVTRAAKVQSGQTVLVAGAVGGVGRAAVLTAKKAGAVVIAGVRTKQLAAAKELRVDEVLAIDDEKAMERLGFVDAVVDTVGHKTAEMLMGKVKPGGVFASVLGAPENAKMHPTIRVEVLRVEPDARKLRELAEDVLAERLKIPIDRMLPLEDAAEGQAAAEKGGIGKVVLVA